MSYWRRLTASSLCIAAFAGCTVKPTAFTEEEYRSLIQADQVAWIGLIDPITGPVTLDEAIARALKYNLDHRVRLLEQAQAAANFEAGKFDILPRLMANAGYHWRDNEAIRDSIDSVTGTPSLANPSISSQRERTNADLTLSWSLLDFGLGYYNAKQNADRILVANERRRKAMHTLIRDVTTTYWRALASQQLSEQVSESIREAEQALDDADEILAAQINNPTDTLRYQRNLLENLRLLENVERELASARIELATLLSLPPGSRVELIEPARSGLRPLGEDMEELEAIALFSNADLREQSYNARIAAQETRKTLLRMIPGLSFNYGQNYDDDTYLVNQQWNQASVTAGFNLFNILSAPANRRASQFGAEVEETRRMAVQVAVLSQLHLSAHQYNDALRQYLRAESIFNVDRRLSELSRDQQVSQMGSPLERISSEVTEILSSVRMYQSMARVNEACGRVQATLGLEPQIGSLDELDLQELRREIVRSYDQMAATNSQQWSCQVDGTATMESVMLEPSILNEGLSLPVGS
jgi:outer membrane protein TolC